MQYSKVPGTINPADLMTKYFTAEPMGAILHDQKEAPVLSNLQTGNAIWEMACHGAQAATNTGYEYEKEMHARCQQVVSNLGCRTWRNIAQSQDEAMGCTRHDEDYEVQNAARHDYKRNI